MTATCAGLNSVREHEAPSIVRDLLRPEAYRDLHPIRIEFRVTHASWVFLTERDVFKVKRPVDFGFLDFRTLESRRLACEREVRLNKRLAPDVYLGTVPIHHTIAGHFLGHDGFNSGAVVDWAVHMRRLPDEVSAASLLAARRLGPEQLERLAQYVGPFLAAAPRTPEYGSIATLRANVEENRTQTLPFCGAGNLIDVRTMNEIWQFQVRELARHADRFAARPAAGRIREGHGDLRLDHVYFVRAASGVEQPIVIDCIEFNDRFRCGDVTAELAFLAMELEVAGRPDLAAGFVARAVEVLDDFDVYGLLDFYLCYRAWVRAKVAAFVASDESQVSAACSRKREEAQRDFAFARACAGRRAARPFLVAVGGLVGTGKSTLAATLGRALAVPVVSSDRTRKSLAGLAPTDRGGTELYTDGHTEATYSELARRTRVVLESGRSVIADATFAERRWRALMADTARACGASFIFVEAHCPDRTIVRNRVALRAAGPSESDATAGLVDDLAARHQPRLVTEEGTFVRIDTSGQADVTAATALAELMSLGITGPGIGTVGRG